MAGCLTGRRSTSRQVSTPPLLPRHSVEAAHPQLRRCRRAQEAGTGEDEEEGEEEGEDDDDDDISFASRLAASDLNAAYFRRWDDPAVHQSMMQDRVLTAAWREALAAAPPGALEGRTVLDVGCGLGLLSMLAAKAGAARVVAVDGSEGAVDAARRIIKANGLSDKITVVHGVLEELDELPGMSPSGFDVVMSNWMGPALLGGGMMATLAHAIKKWLRPGGVVLPDRVSLWAAGLEDRDALQEAKESWSRVAGLDMSAALSQVIKHPRRDVITRKAQLLTAPQRLAVWDLTELRPEHVLVMRRSGGRDRNEEEEEEEGEEEEQEEAVYASCPFRFTSLRDERLFGLVLFWEALWTWGGALEGEGKSPVRFTTHPLASSTHYQQIMIDMPRTVRVAADDEVSGELVLKPGSTDPRDVEMQLRVEHGGAQQPITASYRVAHLAV
ncbi:hypothetical protein VOLCADRAFT_99370 [Volvox carteri f. nagariensis]|uniref:Methyltransferase domain-containing protein n=1 Tax=Volvox carteri f. nagariensis TaxID=3068 RepID=D8UHM9_VOLCA|nr:uncharacterized protein VOLCADRAFT_99370 [Volvox carteri f. nagariensis]EFJ40775.1 hypothetical protein VOLCADRAFT_99370 [Volvox carteri f. nagariensis]|eukprot:XP_002958150.1 hypothetical protein VOLCADRAFT_99370 [Volvox carteri f. nagariensis]